MSSNLYCQVASINPENLLLFFSVRRMSDVLLNACKELIDDAKFGCADLVFKEICIEILARARNVLTNSEFEILIQYADERIQEKTQIGIDTRLEAKNLH